MFVCCYPENQSFYRLTMLRRKDSNLRPLGYEPSELPTATTPLYPYAKLKTVLFNIRTKKTAILTDNGIDRKKSNQFYLIVIEIKSDIDLHEMDSGICSSDCDKLVFALKENVLGSV